MQLLIISSATPVESKKSLPEPELRLTQTQELSDEMG